MAKLYVPLIKRSVSKQFEAIFGNLIFWRKFDKRDPYKNSEILYSLKLWLENIFWLNYMFPSSKEVLLHNFRQFLENWYVDGILTGASLTKIVKFCSLLNCDKEIFFGKIICSPHLKKCFSTILGNFWKIEFFDGNSTGVDLTKIVKFCTILNCDKIIFFD